MSYVNLLVLWACIGMFAAFFAGLVSTFKPIRVLAIPLVAIAIYGLYPALRYFLSLSFEIWQ